MSQVDRLPLSIKHFFSPRAFMRLAYLTGSQRLHSVFSRNKAGWLSIHCSVFRKGFLSL